MKEDKREYKKINLSAMKPSLREEMEYLFRRSNYDSEEPIPASCYPVFLLLVERIEQLEREVKGLKSEADIRERDKNKPPRP